MMMVHGPDWVGTIPAPSGSAPAHGDGFCSVSQANPSETPVLAEARSVCGCAEFDEGDGAVARALIVRIGRARHRGGSRRDDHVRRLAGIDGASENSRHAGAPRRHHNQAPGWRIRTACASTLPNCCCRPPNPSRRPGWTRLRAGGSRGPSLWTAIPAARCCWWPTRSAWRSTWPCSRFPAAAPLRLAGWRGGVGASVAAALWGLSPFLPCPVSCQPRALLCPLNEHGGRL